MCSTALWQELLITTRRSVAQHLVDVNNIWTDRALGAIQFPEWTYLRIVCVFARVLNDCTQLAFMAWTCLRTAMIRIDRVYELVWPAVGLIKRPGIYMHDARIANRWRHVQWLAEVNGHAFSGTVCSITFFSSFRIGHLPVPAIHPFDIAIPPFDIWFSLMCITSDYMWKQTFIIVNKSARTQTHTNS